MRIFLSHSSRDKPLVREIRADLPRKVDGWIDERDLTLGENINDSLRKAITSDSDFLVVFISPEAVRSEWVRRELLWALDHEKEIGRVFVLPLVLDHESWLQLPEAIRAKKFLSCTDFTRSGVQRLAKDLGDELFALVTQEFDKCSSHTATVQEQDQRRRREHVKRLAAQVSDSQNKPNGDGPLSRERLEFIVSSLDPDAKLQLLLLYEVTRGRFREQAAQTNMASIRSVDVTLRLAHGQEWSRLLNFESEGFKTVQKDYGLGNEEYFVRPVFLDGLHSLRESERQELFYGMEIIACQFLAW